MKRYFRFTSESVTEGHPDKVADQISDAILDAYLAGDPYSRVAAETAVNTGTVYVFGEITSQANPDLDEVIRNVIRNIGYTKAEYGFAADSVGIIFGLKRQSPDIAMGVNKSLEAKVGEADTEEETIGAGDQGMMIGYAVAETDVYMPLPIYLAHKLVKRLADVRKRGDLPFLRPDGKSQVTVEYELDTETGIRRPIKITDVVVSAQHDDMDMEELREKILEHVILPVLPEELMPSKYVINVPEDDPAMDSDTLRIFINPTGRFVIGGPKGDAGLTGRKIMVDTYGSMASHGGGAFSGKDPTKVDRSAAYMARYIAKNIVASGLAYEATVQIAYAIGVAEPVSLMIDTRGTGKVPEIEIAKWFEENIDMTPGGIIKRFDLRRPIYLQTAAYGHFGREGFPWEATDLVDELRKHFGV
ncbi:methionine adenosyltransferase [bacterium 3DAC]|nr:methionine adenosyltransferase [bacterium 3DAC]